jgi:protoheme ferro-lyase
MFSSHGVSHDARCQDIIRLPRLFRFLQKPLAKFISIVRAPKSKEGYASIGGGSPLRQITDAQVQFYLLLFRLLSARAAMC